MKYHTSRKAIIDSSPEDLWRKVSDFLGRGRYDGGISTLRPERHGLWRTVASEDLETLEERLHHSEATWSTGYRVISPGQSGYLDAKVKVWRSPADKAGILWMTQQVLAGDSYSNEGDVFSRREMSAVEALVEGMGGYLLPSPSHNFGAVARVEIDAKLKDVWMVAGDFFGIAEWVPGIRGVEKVSAGRRFVYIQDGNIVEDQTEIVRNDSAFLVVYDTRLEPDSAYPCDDYTSALKAWRSPNGGCYIVWAGQFTPSNPEDTEAASRVATGMAAEYQAALHHLRYKFRSDLEGTASNSGLLGGD